MSKPNLVDFARLQQMVTAPPLHRWLGVQLTALDETMVEITMPWRAEFVANTEIGYTHGGIIASLIDLAGDYAIAAKLGHGVPTIDLRTDYHATAMPGPLVARARLVKLGRTLATADVQVFGETGELLASGRGVYFTMKRESAKS
jgi:uncharacterized protein (TIGR00369 family)